MRRCLACSSLCEHYALHTCYYARASFMKPRQALNDVQMQATISSTLVHRLYLLLTRQGGQEYVVHLFSSVQ